MSRMFPVIYSGRYHFAGEVQALRELGLYAFIIGVPWDMIAPCEERCKKNHGGSLKMMEQRGGLTAGDVVAILSDCARHDIADSNNQPYQHRVLLEMIQIWHRRML